MNKQHSRTDPLPFFILSGVTVLYVGTKNAYLFSAPLDQLAHFKEPEEVEIDLEEELTAQELETEDVADLEHMRSEAHPLGRITSCKHLADKAARRNLADADPLEDGGDEGVRASLAAWADYCDGVAKEMAKDVPLDTVLTAPRLRRWAGECEMTGHT